MKITNELAEKGVTIYMVGCEPSITMYKDFFMALCHITGGQYVPLGKASLLSQVGLLGTFMMYEVVFNAVIHISAILTNYLPLLTNYFIISVPRFV